MPSPSALGRGVRAEWGRGGRDARAGYQPVSRRHRHADRAQPRLSSCSRTSHRRHIGGLVGGVLVGLVFHLADRRRTRRWPTRAAWGSPPSPSPARSPWRSASAPLASTLRRASDPRCWGRSRTCAPSGSSRSSSRCADCSRGVARHGLGVRRRWALLLVAASSRSLFGWYTIWPLPFAALSRDRRLLAATLFLQAIFVAHLLPAAVVVACAGCVSPMPRSRSRAGAGRGHGGQRGPRHRLPPAAAGRPPGLRHVARTLRRPLQDRCRATRRQRDVLCAAALGARYRQCVVVTRAGRVAGDSARRRASGYAAGGASEPPRDAACAQRRPRLSGPGRPHEQGVGLALLVAAPSLRRATLKPWAGVERPCGVVALEDESSRLSGRRCWAWRRSRLPIPDRWWAGWT